MFQWSRPCFICGDPSWCRHRETEIAECPSPAQIYQLQLSAGGGLRKGPARDERKPALKVREPLSAS